MKWLIVTLPEYAAEAKSVENFLKNKKTNSVVYTFDSRIQSLNIFDITTPFYKTLESMLFETTHCVVLHAEVFIRTAIFPYAAGILRGRNIPIFFTGYAQNAAVPMLFEGMNGYSDTKMLVSQLEKQFVSYCVEEKKESAREKLYKKGLPFTPDCFSFQIAQGNRKECELFIIAGMDVNVRDSAGTPMICIAARYEKKEILKILMKNGADINILSKDRGYSAVMDAIWRNNTELVDFIISYNPNLNIVSNDGQTPLVLAVGNGNEDVCRMLVKNGANLHVKDHMGMTAYEYAKLFNKEAIVKIFDEYGK